MLTIPGVVKSYKEKTWERSSDVFQKKLEVALKTMNTDGRLSGYDTTISFVNELKKNIKITKVCPDQVEECFTRKVNWTEGEEAIEVKQDSVQYKEQEGYDWAETVGVQFSNGITALISYNKNCYVDPYASSSTSINQSCLGLIYDVTAQGKPNKNGSDIIANANVEALGNVESCVYKMQNGTCFTNILEPGTDYGAFPMTIGSKTYTCSQARDAGLINVSSCSYGEGGSTYPDYWAGAVYACGGVKDNLPDQNILYALAQEVYGTTAINGGSSTTSGLRFVDEYAAPFLAKSPGRNEPSFFVWARNETSALEVGARYFDSTSINPTYNTNFSNSTPRTYTYMLAICVGK